MKATTFPSPRWLRRGYRSTLLRRPLRAFKIVDAILNGRASSDIMLPIPPGLLCEPWTHRRERLVYSKRQWERSACFAPKVAIERFRRPPRKLAYILQCERCRLGAQPRRPLNRYLGRSVSVRRFIRNLLVRANATLIGHVAKSPHCVDLLEVPNFPKVLDESEVATYPYDRAHLSWVPPS